MENIKVYFQNLLIALAYMILSSIPSNTSTDDIPSIDNNDDPDDFHMFI
mgnify:CR=1 FL=1